jgi:hypothetical protein
MPGPPLGSLRRGVGYPTQATIAFSVNQWTNASKTHHSSQYGGTSSMRDIPRYVTLIWSVGCTTRSRSSRRSTRSNR